MLPTEPLQLHHSWPIFERGLRFSDGMLGVGRSVGLGIDGAFSCDLTTNRLTWSDTTFALFGLPRGIAPVRELVLSLYRPESRSAVERLRNHAVRHRRGFTIDTAIDAPGWPLRWLRVVAVTEIEKGRAVRLHGIHQDVTHEYR